MNLKMKNLENCFNAAINNNSKWVGIRIKGRSGVDTLKVIHRSNFKETLIHLKYNYIGPIVGFTYADSLAGVESDLWKED